MNYLKYHSGSRASVRSREDVEFDLSEDPVKTPTTHNQSSMKVFPVCDTSIVL